MKENHLSLKSNIHQKLRSLQNLNIKKILMNKFNKVI